MAGPTASVLMMKKIDSQVSDEIIDYLNSTAEDVKGNDFWINGRPFFYSIGEELGGELREQSIVQIPEYSGKTPVDILVFAAMCNDDCDHNKLADLCLYFGEKFNGLIDFHGDIRIRPDHQKHYDGLLFQLEDDRGTHIAFSHVGDTEFLRWFIQQPNFRMIK